MSLDLEKLVKETIQESLSGLLDSSLEESNVNSKVEEKTNQDLNEAYVTAAPKFDLKTELLSDKNKNAHQELMEGYVKTLNEISAELDSANKDEANINHSKWRSLKTDEAYNHNGAFLHGLFFHNISDLNSQISMNSLSFMKLERDFGSFDNWQEDFIACAISSRNGWAITAYNTQLRRYVNLMVDLHSDSVMIGCQPVIVLDCWEHSYYRDYLKNRKAYIHAMMKELNWDVIERRIEKTEKIHKILG